MVANKTTPEVVAAGVATIVIMEAMATAMEAEGTAPAAVPHPHLIAVVVMTPTWLPFYMK